MATNPYANLYNGWAGIVYGNPGVWGNRRRAGRIKARPTTGGYRTNPNIQGVGNTYPGAPQGGPYIGTLPSGYSFGTPGAGTGQAPVPVPKIDPVFDYTADPSLQEFNIRAARNLQEGKARLIETQKRLLSQLGSREIAQKVLPKDTGFLSTISDDENSMSMLGRLRRAYNQSLVGIDQATSNVNANLFFSSERAKQMQEMAYERQKGTTEAIGQTEQGLQGARDEYTGLERQIEEERRAAEQAAYMRWLLEQLQNGGAGGGITDTGGDGTGAGTGTGTGAGTGTGTGDGPEPGESRVDENGVTWIYGAWPEGPGWRKMVNGSAVPG